MTVQNSILPDLVCLQAAATELLVTCHYISSGLCSNNSTQYMKLS